MVALRCVREANFCSRRLAPTFFIMGSSEADALRSSVQVPLKSGLSGRSGLGAADVWARLKTPRHARAASERNRRCLIRVGSAFNLIRSGRQMWIYPARSFLGSRYSVDFGQESVVLRGCCAENWLETNEMKPRYR